MQYAYIKHSGRGKYLLGRIKYTEEKAGGNRLYRIEYAGSAKRAAKKLRRLNINVYWGKTDMPGIKKYNPSGYYKYFIPQVVNHMLKNCPADKIVLCGAAAEDVLYTAKAIADKNLSLGITENNCAAVQLCLEATGIPVIVTERPEECILINFGGGRVNAGNNVYTVNFTNSVFIFENRCESMALACLLNEFAGNKTPAEGYRIIKIENK